MYYTEPRFTKDLDIWVNPMPANAIRVYNALNRFGAPLGDLNADEFTDPNTVFQIGVEPNRIDVLTDVAGLCFGEAYLKKRSSCMIMCRFPFSDHMMLYELSLPPGVPWT